MKDPWNSFKEMKKHQNIKKYLDPIFVHPSYVKLAEKASEVFILSGLISLAFSIFTLKTILSFLLFFGSLCFFIKITLDKYQSKGIINTLPPFLKRILLERSIFDILCDLWFFQKIGLYLQYLVGPFIIKITPEEIVDHLNELGPQTKKMILTKGLVNLFPKSVKSILIPKKKAINETISTKNSSSLQLQHFDYDTDVNMKNESIIGSPSTSVNKIDNSFIPKKQRRYSDDSSDHGINGKTPQQKEKEEFEKRCAKPKLSTNNLNKMKEVPSAVSLGFQEEIANTEKNLALFEQFAPFERNSDFDASSSNILKPNRNSYGIRKSHSYRDQTTKGKGQNFFENLKLDELKTVTLASSTMAKENKERKRNERLISSGNETDVVVNDKWDNIEIYKKKQQMLLEKKKTPNFKGPLGIISKLMEIKNGGITSVISGKSLFKLFIISSAGLLFQLRISRRARAWLPNSIVLIFYILAIIFSSSSLLFVWVKYLKERRNAKKKEIEKT